MRSVRPMFAFSCRFVICQEDGMVCCDVGCHLADAIGWPVMTSAEICLYAACKDVTLVMPILFISSDTHLWDIIAIVAILTFRMHDAFFVVCLGYNYLYMVLLAFINQVKSERKSISAKPL